jgi:hypothetical protein
MADLVGDVAQPAAGRRSPGLALPRQSHHRHAALPPCQRPRTAGPHRPHQTDSPSARTPALARRLAEPDRRRPPPAIGGLTTPPRSRTLTAAPATGITATPISPDPETPSDRPRPARGRLRTPSNPCQARPTAPGERSAPEKINRYIRAQEPWLRLSPDSTVGSPPQLGRAETYPSTTWQVAM